MYRRVKKNDFPALCSTASMPPPMDFSHIKTIVEPIVHEVVDDLPTGWIRLTTPFPPKHADEGRYRLDRDRRVVHYLRKKWNLYHTVPKDYEDDGYEFHEYDDYEEESVESESAEDPEEWEFSD